MTFRATRILPIALVGLLLTAPSPWAAEQAANGDRAKLLARLGADRWHAAGTRGQGVKVLVIDSGFRGWRSRLGTILPRLVLARSFRTDAALEARDSQHGVLCGEVIHALAPDAELLFANWEPDDADSFVRAIDWARGQGVRVVSCSVIMPCWSDGEGGGPVHAALTRLMGGGDAVGEMLGFACAGNTAQRHWRGTYRAGSDGRHEWSPGQTDNGITAWGDERVSVEVCHPAGAGYVVQVVSETNGAEVGRAVAAADGHSAVVRFMPARDERYVVRVWPAVPSAAGPFHVAVLGGWLERATERGSIPFPADGPEFVAVGAVEATGRRAAYSSCGPNGPRPKPDFVAEVPLWTAARVQPFSGTSAAAPQAAGLAALLMSRHPQWAPAKVRDALRRAAVDLESPGHDPETGYGLLRLPAD